MQQRMMINTNAARDVYRKQDVLTASPIDLIIMLYDALKRNMVMGRRGIEKKDVPMAHKHLMKSQLILTELINSLDMSYQISEELLELYEFGLRSLTEANIHKDAAPLEPVIEMIDSIREAWQEVSNANKGTMKIADIG